MLTDIHDDNELRYDYNYDESHENSEESNIIDVLIKEKIDDMLEKFKDAFDNIFEELDAAYDNPDIIENYLSSLEPVQRGIENRIEEEIRLIHQLASRIMESDIYTVHKLLKESKQLLKKLESAQYFINNLYIPY